MRGPRSRAWYTAVAVVVLALSEQLNALLKLLGLRRLFDWLVVLGLRNTLEVALCFVGVWVAHRFGFARGARELGLRAPWRRALMFALLASLPMLIVFAFTFSVNPRMTLLTVGVGCLLAPFAEEVLYRGYMFRQLYRRARLGFWLSALLPSVLFALAHVYQSKELGELIGILAVTGVGSIGFCWVFMRWQDNLWAVFGLHATMNLWWEVFAVDDTALGGWLANGARLLTVVLAILLTIYKDRIWKPLAEEAENVAITREDPVDSAAAKRTALVSSGM